MNSFPNHLFPLASLPAPVQFLRAFSALPRVRRQVGTVQKPPPVRPITLVLSARTSVSIPRRFRVETLRISVSLPRFPLSRVQTARAKTPPTARSHVVTPRFPFLNSCACSLRFPIRFPTLSFSPRSFAPPSLILPSTRSFPLARRQFHLSILPHLASRWPRCRRITASNRQTLPVSRVIHL